jgi:hypothetical protein
MAERFENILSECIDRVLQGESLESCLGRYPQQAGELAPLLRTALAARQASAVEVRPDFKARVRYEVQSRAAAAGLRTQGKGTPFWGWVPRWAVVVAAVFLVVLVAGSGTVAASSDTVPGDTLYSVKTTTERVRMFFAFSDTAKAKLEAGFAGRRVREMARMARRGDAVRLETLRTRFSEHLARIDRLAARIAEADLENAATIAELEAIMYRNMARDDALLQAAYGEAPLTLRPAIQLARIKLMQSYEGVIDGLRARYGQQTWYGGGTSGTPGLLADTEVAEDGFQKVFVNCFTGDLAQGGEGGGDVYADEVVGHAGGNGLQGAV